MKKYLLASAIAFTALFTVLFAPNTALAQSQCLAYSVVAKTVSTATYRLSGPDNCSVLVVSQDNAVITVPAPGTGGDLTGGYNVKIFNASTSTITLGGTINSATNPTVPRGYTSELVLGPTGWVANYTSTNPVTGGGGSPSAGLVGNIQLADGSGGFTALVQGTGAAIDYVSGFSSTGFQRRTGSGTYSFLDSSGILDLLGNTRGSILYRGAGGWTPLTPGSNGQVLTTGGAGANLSWSTAGSGSPAGVNGDIQTNSSGSFGALTPGAGIAAWLADPTSAKLLAALTTKTGTGSAVFNISPSFTTPALGTIASGDLGNGTNVPMGAASGTLLSTHGGTGCTAIDCARNALLIDARTDGTAANTSLTAADHYITLGRTNWGSGFTYKLPAISAVYDGNIVEIADAYKVLNGAVLTIDVATASGDVLNGTTQLSSIGGRVYCRAQSTAQTWACWPGISNSTSSGQILIGQGPTTPGAWTLMSGGATMDAFGVVSIAKFGLMTPPASVLTNDLMYASTLNTLARLTLGNSKVLCTDGSGVPSGCATVPASTLTGKAPYCEAWITAAGTITPSGCGTVSSGTWTSPAWITASTYAEFDVLGGGGGGAGCNNGANLAGAGSAAGLAKLSGVNIIAATTGYTFIVGAGGASIAANTNSSGNDGTDSTLVVGGTTYTGGHGSSITVCNGLNRIVAGGSATNGTLNISGGGSFSSGTAISQGGSAPLGFGLGGVANIGGSISASTGYGSGGQGAYGTTGASGAGGAGVIHVRLMGQ